MSKKQGNTTELNDTPPKVEAQTVTPEVLPSQDEVPISFSQSLVLKRKAAVDAAVKAYELALQRRISELGKLCIDCGLGDYDINFLKEQFTKLFASFPKRKPPQ